MNYYFCGINAESVDSIDSVYAFFPIEIGVVLAVVLLLVGLAFKSLLVPLRSIFSISMTLAFVYGLSTLIYEKGILSWLNFAPLGKYDAIIWLPPVVSFAIIVGIAVDYDVFLLVRIKEFRMEGYSTHDSVVLGIQKTGTIITSAGLIMFIAFGGFLKIINFII